VFPSTRCLIESGDLERSSRLEAGRGELEAGRPGVLTAFVHLSDMALLRAMKVETLRGSRRKGFRLEFFNPYLTGIRLLLDRHPAFEDGAGTPVPSPQVCVVGDGILATTLILFLAAEWSRARPGEGRLPLLVAGPRAFDFVEELLSIHPRVAEVCNLDPRAEEIESARFQSGAILLSPDVTSTPTKAYIALEDESQALEAALGMHGQPATEQVPTSPMK